MAYKKKHRARGTAPRARSGPSRQRQRLIDACITALHLHGPSRTTVEKVVAIAKMSPGIVRFYFDSKAAMLVASLQHLATDFEEHVLLPVAELKSTPAAALRLLVDLYLDPDIASARKVSVWYAFWGEASSRQEYYDICGQKDESSTALVRELIEALILETSQTQLDADAIALGLIGVLEILWQDIAFQTERDIDRESARRRAMAFLRSLFPGRFDDPLPPPEFAHAAAQGYGASRAAALERDALFANAWSLVGHDAQIEQPGEFISLDSGIERVLLVRGATGSIHALRNSCPAAPHALVSGLNGGLDGPIECERHGLAFNWDGSAVVTGAAELVRLDLLPLGCLLFVKRAGGQAQAVDFDPPPGLRCFAMPLQIEVAADWKVLMELWLESAPDPGAATPYVGDDLVWDGLAVRRQFLAPNQLLETRYDGLTVLQAVPDSPDRSMLRRFDFTLLSSDEAARAARDPPGRNASQADHAIVAMAESIQRGRVQFGYDPPGNRSLAPGVAWFRRYLLAHAQARAPLAPPSAA